MNQHGSSAPLTVLLADVQPAVRQGVRAMVEASGGVAVVGEASTTGEVLAATTRHRPDVLVLDPLMDDAPGMRMITQVVRLTPATGVLVFSTLDDDKTVATAFHAGARGYLVKRATADQILRGIHAVGAGDAIVDRTIAARLCTLIGAAPRIVRSYPFPQLSDREREVLEHLAAGRSTTAIARELELASKTISNRLSSIFGKLGVADRAQAIVLARDAGLGLRRD
ncbi:response regulator transcription factor [Kitasatospora sp. NPDC049285]|uniref:response regulator transcription factor n=1 Tax=Kitasatospora sp. NPDC049285 TaxID=3157096 RepID=UPI00341CE6C6